MRTIVPAFECCGRAFHRLLLGNLFVPHEPIFRWMWGSFGPVAGENRGTANPFRLPMCLGEDRFPELSGKYPDVRCGTAEKSVHDIRTVQKWRGWLILWACFHEHSVKCYGPFGCRQSLKHPRCYQITDRRWFG